jgi:putative radical SAM enzyme (TIGR03279 family)
MKKYKNQVEENEQSRIARNEARRAENGSGFRGAVVAEVEPGSIAEELGIAPGARLLEINGRPARDAIQLKMADASDALTLTVLQPDGPHHFDIEKDTFEPLGLHVDAELFDGVRRCTNKCPFCFVDQLPQRQKGPNAKNLRRTLYVRDDDYRLSFLHGHYITLTNLSEADFARIIEEKLSPLCVSVHATDAATRIRMVGNRHGGEIMERLRFLIDNGIQINAQLVICPGINDGEILDQSVRDLMALYPGVESVAAVPVGLTKFMPAERGLRTVQPHEAAAMIAQLKPLQKQAKRQWGVNFAYASDEMYLLAGQPMPPASFYDGFPQYANGVGLIRAFLDDVKKLEKRRARSGRAPKITLVTGRLAAPGLRELARVLNEKNIAQAQVAEIENTFWGGNVGCAGLIMGEEILQQLAGRDCGDYLFLPPDAVDNQGRMLDDITLDDLSRELKTVVRRDANGPLDLVSVL